MKFIVQDVPIPWDFVMELYRSQEYYKWRGDSFDIVKFGSTLPNNPREYCPVGSVEFVVDWLETYWGKRPSPINCPDIFDVEQIHLPTPLIPIDEIKKSFPRYTEFFIKSERTIKSPINGKYTINDTRLDSPFSDPVVIRPWRSDIVSEWRIFVKDGKILDIKSYSGDPFKIPERCVCEKHCKAYHLLTDSPAFTLDVAVTEILDVYLNHTDLMIIEIHDFFSCGTYGFSDYRSYPIMLWRWFNWFIKK